MENAEVPKLGISQMYEMLCNSIIRPPRMYYEFSDLGPSSFFVGKMKFVRSDMELVNQRGLTLQCSYFAPENSSEERPCVIYCHGNCGSRLDAREALRCALPYCNLFTLDFSGCGLSEGEYISLGFFEQQDLNAVIEYLRSTGKVSRIGIWGRSMGGATALLYGSTDPSISCLVIDSSFCSLRKLAEEISSQMKWKIPKLMVSVAMVAIRKSIKKRANFDINLLEPIKVVSKCVIPALFTHGKEDNFVGSHHTQQLYDKYAGDKNLVFVEGDHNSIRPDFLYDSISIFFYNKLLSDKEKEKYENVHTCARPDGHILHSDSLVQPMDLMAFLNSDPVESSTEEKEDYELTKAIEESLKVSQQNSDKLEIEGNEEQKCPICSKTLSSSLQEINEHIDKCIQG